MAYLPDINISAIKADDTAEILKSIVKQLNDWGKSVSNETTTNVYKDTSGTNRIIIGILPDKTSGIVISKSGTDVNTVFS